MLNYAISFIVVIVFFIVILYMSQQKLKNKILCTFRRPNKQKIEQWVPLYANYVVFDRGKYGIGHYVVDPRCITMMWYDRGLHKLFPVLIPTLDYKWDTPNPLNPETFESTWHTPEARQAGWEEHQHVAFAKAAAAQAGIKQSRLQFFLPFIAIGVSLIVLFIVWRGFAGLDLRMFNLEQMMKLR